MPRTETIITLFLSSPSDVAEERDICESVVTELNATWSREFGIRMDLLRWESAARPGFGQDPQDVLNSQLLADYDVFIGFLWGRIGSPTPRAGSGTLEEFEHAFDRFVQDSGSVEIMFYFKDAGIPPSKVDPHQLEQVIQFRETLSEKGGLYSTFNDAMIFEQSLRAHLASLIQKFASSAIESIKDSQKSDSVSEHKRSDEERTSSSLLET